MRKKPGLTMRQSVGIAVSGGSGDGPVVGDRRRRVVAGAERNAARHRGVAHAGQRAERFHQLRDRTPRLHRAAVTRLRQRELERQHPLRLEPEVHLLQPKQALAEQPGGDQQHRRERELRGGETVAEPRTRAAGRRARRLLQHRRSDRLSPRATPARGRTAGRWRRSPRARTAGRSSRRERSAPAGGSAA